MEGLTIKEAAEQLQVHEKTVRHRIRTGELRGVKVPRPQGFEWRVFLDGAAPTQVIPDDMEVSTDEAHVGSPSSSVDSVELVRLVEKLYEDNRQLAGQVGFLQAKLQDAEQKVHLLTVELDERQVPQQGEPAPAAKPRPLWRQ